MSSTELLDILPPFEGKQELIVDDQGTRDIVKEVQKAHRIFAPHYDRMVSEWMTGDLSKVPYKLYRFCKTHMKYREESEEDQTTRSPAGILAMKYVDCKHYASWIAGVLDSINRTGDYYYDWCFRFASYKWYKKSPGHVFVVLKDRQSGREWWIDPVPELNGFDARNKKPSHFYDKKPTMSLTRLSGIGEDTGMDSRKMNHRVSPYCGYASMSGASMGANAAAEQKLLDALRAFEQSLGTAVTSLQNNGQVSSITDEILKQASGIVPGAAEALAYSKTITSAVSSAFGASSSLTRAVDSLASGNITGLIDSLFNGRTYNTDNYFGASDYSFYVLGKDVGASTNVPDADVFPALRWFILKTGVFVSGRAHINALRAGVQPYLDMYKVNTYTTQDRVRVQLAVDVVQKYMPDNKTLRAWANTIGVYDNAVTAAIAKARLATPNAATDTTGTIPTTSATTQASILPKMDNKEWLILGGIALGLWGLHEISKPKSNRR